MATELQQTLSEIRSLRSDFQELSLQIRIDTPWVRLRENIKHAINLVKEIPILSRLAIFLGTILLTIPYVIQVSEETRKKLMMFAIDCFSLALVVASY